MIKTVATIRLFILLLTLGLPACVLATDITCTVTGSNPYCGGTAGTVNYNGTPVPFNPGNVFNVELSDASGSFATPVVIGTSTSTSPTGSISITFPANASGTGYRVRVTSSDQADIGTDNGSDITINPATNTSVTIVIDKPGAILCDTQTATFTATPTPNVASSYGWTRNGTPVGINSSIYTASDFHNGDAVKVTMTSSASCPLPTAAVSNTIVIIQQTTLAPSVSIAGPPTVCSGVNVTFTATPINGGSSPSYQWRRNGNPIGTNSSTFVTNTLTTGDVIIADMTSNRECISPPTASSNNLNITVTSTVTPAITITPDPSTPVGIGSVVYVSSAITGGGSAPVYDWKRNGVSLGSTSNVLVVPNAVNNDQIVATLTSNANCATPSVVNSNTITLDVDGSMTQSGHAWAPRTPQTDISGMIMRINASGFSIGTKAYIGVGYVGSTSTPRKDLWEYDPSTDAWTQKADFPGAARYNAVGFSANNKGYIGMGTSGGTTYKDFYQYDPTTNTWIARASLPGQVREQAFCFGIGNKGYVGGGYATGFGDFNDFYEFDQAGNTWTAKASFGGGKRLGAAAFSIGTKGFVAGGYSTTSTTWFKDFWDYDQAAGVWTQRVDMPGVGRSRVMGFALAGNGYVGLGNTSSGYEGQMFQYTLSTNTWSYKPYYPGPQTPNAAVGMSIGNRAFVHKDGTWTEYNLFTTTSFSSEICTSEVIPISFDASGFAFDPGNTFTVQMSSLQNFSVSTLLGSLSSNASSGVISATIPTNTPPGDYFIRLISSSIPMSTLLEPVTITAIPGSQTITAVGGASVCKDVATNFTSNLTGTGFQWFKNNVPVGTDSQGYTDSGLVTGDVVKAIKSFTVGCSQPTGVGSNLITMTVHSPAKPVVTVSQPNKLTSTSAYGYQWLKDDNAISKATAQSYVMIESGTYKVRTTDIYGCIAFSNDLPDAFTGIDDEAIAGQINMYPNPVKGEMILEVSDDLVMQGVDYSVLNELGQQVIPSQKASRSNKINFSGRSSGLYLVRLSINGSTVVRRVMKVD